MARSTTMLSFALLICALGSVVCQVDHAPITTTGDSSDVECLFCKILAEQVQTKVKSAANVTEQLALNITSNECGSVASKLHLPETICSEIIPLVKSELDKFEGSIVDFFNPDTVCTAIKLCDEDDQLAAMAAQRNQLEQNALGDSIECDLCHAVVDAVKQNLSSYDIVIAQDISGMLNSTCLDFVAAFKIEPEACSDIYEALVDITLGLEEDLVDYLSGKVCNLAGICSSEERQSEDESIAIPQIESTQDLASADEGDSLQCTLCQALAGSTQNYVATEVNITEALALNYTQTECTQLASQYHLPAFTCSYIIPLIKGKLDDFKGPIIDFFAPDYLCPLIKLCPKNNTFGVGQEGSSVRTSLSSSDAGVAQSNADLGCSLCEVIVDAIVANISGYETSAVEKITDSVDSFCEGVVSSLDLPISICDDVADAVRIVIDTYSGDIAGFLTSNVCPLIGLCPKGNALVSDRHSSAISRSSRGDVQSSTEETCTTCLLALGQVQSYIQTSPDSSASETAGFFLRSCQNIAEELHGGDRTCSIMHPVVIGALNRPGENLVESLDPDTLCSATKLCKELQDTYQDNEEAGTNLVARPSPSSNDLGDLVPCTLCELVVDSIAGDLSSYENKTISDIMQSTDASCTSLATTLKLPVSDFCADIDDAVYKVLLSIESKLDYFVTKDLCTVLRLCPDTPSPTPGPEALPPPESSPMPPSPPQNPPATQPSPVEDTDGASSLAQHHSFLMWTVAAVLLLCSLLR